MDDPSDEEPVTGRAPPATDDAFSGLPIPAKGTLLLGKYRVEGVIGIGGMGVVVAARHEHLNERVALKMLLPRFAELTETRKRFQREAQAAYKLRSEHICRVIDAGELEDGTPFIAMEFLKGEDLAAELRKKKRLPIAEAVDYLLQACEALGEAHANDIVHRDLKPANLVIVTRKDATRCLKLIDFGISKVATDTSSELTNTYGYLGSPSYSAPEQFASTRALTASGDLWSLGVILYELVCGKRPFDFASEGLAEMAAVIVATPAIPLSVRDPSVDPRFEQVVMKCLEKDPEDRYPRVRELAEALAPFASAPPDDLLGRLRRHQPGSVQPSPARPSHTVGPRTEPTPAPAPPRQRTMKLKPPSVQRFRFGTFALPDASGPEPVSDHGQRSSSAPMPSSPSWPRAPSSPAMPMMGPGAPPITRYAVVADPVSYGPASGPRHAWIAGGIAVVAIVGSFIGVLTFRSSHRAGVEPRPIATLEQVPVGVPVVEPSVSAPTETPTETPTESLPAAPSATAARPVITAKPVGPVRGGPRATATAVPPPVEPPPPKIKTTRGG